VRLVGYLNEITELISGVITDCRSSRTAVSPLQFDALTDQEDWAILSDGKVSVD
jgi:hypothetical protein